ncbi:MAG: hypothetical protein Greene071421_413 [Parcubacteria group bacterium Greene0714_21]|nr:MAG: hypothetical protein Greene041639_66 [Parcubacteria group bacterium Greene0416_39]TSC98177.1 MAG: hypothetical protein Greene101447_140 [Parcubacteria group bacterium Greene1014_47]TSD04047.1 MAG: hypothetical protein Greene071421_413 [Parcubacteria group bacterium Greene0714_21]
MAAKIAGSNPVAHPKIMGQTFITITEAARLTGQSDAAIMRVIKDCLQQPGVNPEEILRKEPRGNGFLYVVNKEVLLRELGGTKEEQQPAQETKEAPELKQTPSTGRSDSEESSDSKSSGQASSGQALLEAKNEMIAMLQKVVDTQGGQIEDLSGKVDQLIERDRETNILLKTLQDKLFLLSGKGENKKHA